jgi:hypothetical protein
MSIVFQVVCVYDREEDEVRVYHPNDMNASTTYLCPIVRRHACAWDLSCSFLTGNCGVRYHRVADGPRITVRIKLYLYFEKPRHHDRSAGVS